jgi:hypothetical protein
VASSSNCVMTISISLSLSLFTCSFNSLSFCTTQVSCFYTCTKISYFILFWWWTILVSETINLFEPNLLASSFLFLLKI